MFKATKEILKKDTTNAGDQAVEMKQKQFENDEISKAPQGMAL